MLERESDPAGGYFYLYVARVSRHPLGSDTRYFVHYRICPADDPELAVSGDTKRDINGYDVVSF